MTDLSPNHQRIMEYVKTLKFTDREQLTHLMSDALKENGTEFALRSLVARGYLSKNLRNAHSPRAVEGMSRKRIVYYLAEKGRALFKFTDLQRQRLSWRVSDLGDDMTDLAHEVGISWFQVLMLLGHRSELWDVVFKRGRNIAFTVDGKRHTPDALAVLSATSGTYWRWVEYVNKANLSKSLRHAGRYLEAFDQNLIKGRVVWIAKHSEKVRALRAAIAHAYPDAGDSFIFLAQDECPFDPQRLLGPNLVTTDNKPVALIPSRKPKEQVA